MSAKNGNSASIWGITAVALVCTSFLLTYVVNVLASRTFYTSLSPAVPGGLTFEATAGGPFGYLLAGFIIESLSLIVAIWGMWALLGNIVKNRLYSPQSANKPVVVAFAVLAWMVGRFIEYMGNNYAATKLGVYDQWSESGFNSDTTLLVLVFLLLTMLFLVEKSVRDAVKLQEEVEDLV